jgi:ankyrin repeat protein
MLLWNLAKQLLICSNKYDCYNHTNKSYSKKGTFTMNISHYVVVLTPLIIQSLYGMDNEYKGLSNKTKKDRIYEMVSFNENCPYEKLEQLLSTGIDFNDGGLLTSVVYQAYEPVRILSLFIAHGLQVNNQLAGWCINKTILHVAAHSTKPEIAEFLLQQPGIFCNMQDDEGRTPLHYAAQSQEILLETMATMHRSQRYFDHTKDLKKAAIVKLLLAHGAYPATRDHQGKTPLTFARESDNQATIALLQ